MARDVTWPDSAGRATHLRVLVAGIASLVLTVGLARFAYTPLLPVMREQAGLSYLAGGWLAAFNYAGYIAGALLAAVTGDLQRKFRYYRWGLVVAVASTAAMGLTDHLAVWALLRFVAGMSSTAGMLLASGLVLNWLMREHHRPVLGLHFTGLGIAVSGVGASAVAALPWSGQWLALGALGLVFFVPAWCWMPAPAAMQGAGAGLPVDEPPPSRRWHALLLAAYFCAGFGYVVSATFIVDIVEKMPVMAGQGALVWVVVGVAAVPSSLLWDRIAAALGQVQALLLAYGLQIVSIALPLLSSAPLWNLASAVLYGGTFAGIVSLTLALVGRRFPGNPSKAMARLTLSYGAAQVIAPAMTGAIAAATGSYAGALLATAGVMVLGMGLLLALRRAERSA
ncbi:YbfB/YjiJ family MFS transporter [Pulveribacter suum]|uniref:MFS transporter n=1 Tax=Pulveribacter suum TaxID=2116657 RepID=A0A2P1NK62_9BURK|nr:YbfB/YjiJ family MFS transporter [Pulveribacter suum]AVP57412.1 MFS transporter [Pulveribacter suum]